MNLKEDVISNVHKTIEESGYENLYCEPLIGFVAANNSVFNDLSNILGHKHLLPTDILSNAETIIVYFLPFSEKIAKLIQGEKTILQEWSDVYSITNILLIKISDNLKEMFNEQGIKVSGIPPTNNYNPVTLTSEWSHKSIAVMSGIGSFGLNRLLITKHGTCGRLNSIIIDKYIESSKNSNHNYCLYYQTGKCKVCLERCPSGAISEHGINKFRCNAYLDGKNIHDSQQGCPMCSSGPCAFKGF